MKHTLYLYLVFWVACAGLWVGIFVCGWQLAVGAIVVGAMLYGFIGWWLHTRAWKS